MALALLGCQYARRTSNSRKQASGIPLQLGALGAIALILTGVTWYRDRLGSFDGLSVTDVAIGVALALLVAVAITSSSVTSRVIGIALSAVALAFLLPSLMETVTHMRDGYDFAFTNDELSAQAAGRIPYVNYIPQYSSLVGWLIWPLVKIAPSLASWWSLSAILAMQVACIGIGVLLAVRVGGRRFFGPALIVMSTPLMVTVFHGVQSPATYFQVFPLRTVGPVVLILAAVMVFGSRRRTSTAALIALGALGGVVALNNADFGLPALAVVLAVLMLMWQGRATIMYIGLFVVGSLTVPLVYWLLTWISGSAADLSLYLLYSRTFANAGFLMEPMEPFGWHVPLAALFISGSAIGAVLVRSGLRVGSPTRCLQGTTMFLASGWSLLTMTYFAGRSLVPTMIGGMAYQAGLVSAVMLPLLAHGIRRWRMGSDRAGLSAGVGLAGLAWILALIMGANVPYRSLELWIGSGSGSPQAMNAEALKSLRLGVIRDPELRDAEQAKTLGQLLTSPSTTQLETGIASASGLNSPEAISISPALADFACRNFGELSHVVLLKEYVTFLERTPSCTRALRLAEGIDLPPVPRSDGVVKPVVAIPLAR